MVNTVTREGRGMKFLKNLFKTTKPKYTYWKFTEQGGYFSPTKVKYEKVEIAPFSAFDELELSGLGFKCISKEEFDNRHKRVYK